MSSEKREMNQLVASQVLIDEIPHMSDAGWQQKSEFITPPQKEVKQLRSLKGSYQIHAIMSFFSGVCLLLLLGMLRVMNSLFCCQPASLMWGIIVAIFGCILYYIYSMLQYEKYSSKISQLMGEAGLISASHL